MAWSNYGPDAQRFAKSFHQFNSTVTQFFSSERKHYDLATSESEYVSLKTLQRIRSPGINDDESPDPIYHDIMWLNSLLDAVNHWIYLKVAHSLCFNSKVEGGHGKYYIFSGSITGLANKDGRRARINHLTIPSHTHQTNHRSLSKCSWLSSSQRFTVWGAIPKQFHISKSAVKLTSTHVLFHESVSVSPYWVDLSLKDGVSNTQVRLTERVPVLTHAYHPHLSWPFKGSELRVGLRELEFTPSFTVEEMSVNPWK